MADNDNPTPAPDTAPVPEDPQPETPQSSWIWMKDSSGHPSMTVTFVTIGFWATTLWFVMSIFAKVWGLEIRPFDPAAAAAYLGPLLTLYFGRRWTDAKHGNPNVPPNNTPDSTK